MRTPLTSIRAFSEILHDHPEIDPEQRAHFLGVIIRENERLTRLINQVLDLEKIESGRMEWNIEEVDLAGAIRECVAATDQLFRERGIRVRLDLPPALPAVRADNDRLIQVLTNLVSNAVKFSPPETGEVTIRAAGRNGTAQVDVADNGPGIRPEDHEVIFERFGQVASRATGKPEGTGLGLPISKRIVEHLGGRLWVRSEPGRGATFSFTLPAATAGTGEQGTGTSETEVAQAGR